MRRESVGGLLYSRALAWEESLNSPVLLCWAWFDRSSLTARQTPGKRGLLSYCLDTPDVRSTSGTCLVGGHL